MVASNALIEMARREARRATLKHAQSIAKEIGASTVHVPPLVDQAHKRDNSPFPCQHSMAVRLARPKAVKLKANLARRRIAALRILVTTLKLVRVLIGRRKKMLSNVAAAVVAREPSDQFRNPRGNSEWLEYVAEPSMSASEF